MSKLRVVLIVVAVAVIAIQLVPVDRSNPPVTGEVEAPAAVVEVLRTSCYDCHSNETRWPWYAYVAPVSWLVAEDVEHGREHVNFSTWTQDDAEEQAEHLEEIWEEVEEGEMPLKKYLLLHGDARLTDAGRDVLRSWTAAAAPAPVAAPDARAEESPAETEHEH